MIDQTLYDAYGQRQVSTMFTQLNQYHVVLEVKSGFQSHPTDLRDLYIRSGTATSSSPAATGVVAGGSTTVAGNGPSSTSRRGCAAVGFQPVWRQFRRDAVYRRRNSIGPGFCERKPGAAERFHALGNDHRSHRYQPPGPVPGGHHVF